MFGQGDDLRRAEVREPHYVGGGEARAERLNVVGVESTHIRGNGAELGLGVPRGRHEEGVAGADADFVRGAQYEGGRCWLRC